MFVSRARRVATFLLLLFALPAHAAKWQPVDPAELADTKPQVDPEAGAEILLREVVIHHNEIDEFVRTYYVRAKIYNQRGLEEFAKVELAYDKKTTVRDIAARTIKPDGTILELGKKDVYDRVVVKAGSERVNVKSFAPAGLEVGAIVEYSYTEIADLVEQYAAVGIEEFVLSGYPHLEEAYWFGEGVLPELARRGRWESPLPPSTTRAAVPFGAAAAEPHTDRKATA